MVTVESKEGNIRVIGWESGVDGVIGHLLAAMFMVVMGWEVKHQWQWTFD